LENLKVDVVVIGAGPVGLTAAHLLQKLGISSVVFERNKSTSFHPRGHVVNARTMEIFRQIGVEDAVADVSLPIHRHAGVGFMTSLAGDELGVIWTREGAKPTEQELSSSPSLKRSCPQDELEPVLRIALERAGPAGIVCFGHEIVEIGQESDSVRLRWIAADSSEGMVEAKYVIAADGARSFVREALGVKMSGGSMGQQIGVYFRADLTPWLRDRPYLLWWIYNAKTTGVFISLDGRTRWTYNFAYGQEEARSDFTTERCEAIIRAAVGAEDVEIDIQSILPWRMQARVAEQFRIGNVFLAGDACHPLPPTGGQGMNTGVADVHNLVWKIAYVLSGGAPRELLSTYEPERIPVGRFNVEQSKRNAEKMANSGLAGMLANDKDVSSKIEGPEGHGVRERLAREIPKQREHFDYPGQNLGVAYDSPIIVGDGTPPVPMTIDRYTPSARPGSRAPHFWLMDDGMEVSSLDLFDYSGFTLLAGKDGEPWADAFTGVMAQMGLRGRAYRIGAPGHPAARDGDWLDRYELLESGAVLVRPDGHVAWRSRAGAADPVAILQAALHQALGFRMDAPGTGSP
jgi:putative polyketide hydroxylase